MIEWIDNNPSAFASLASAVIAASVALIVFSLSQYFSRRQSNMQFLTPRLEEIHQILDYEIECNVYRTKVVLAYLEGNDEIATVLQEEPELDLYGHKNASRIIMLVTLYFPRLGPIHQNLFRKRRTLNEVLYEVGERQKIEADFALATVGEFVNSVRLMRAEIVANRDVLVRDCHPLKRYRKTSQAEIAAPPPPMPDPYA